MEVYKKPGAWEVDAGQLGVQGQYLLHREFRTSLGYIFYLKKPKTNQPNFFKNILHLFTHSLCVCVGASMCHGAHGEVQRTSCGVGSPPFLFCEFWGTKLGCHALGKYPYT